MTLMGVGVEVRVVIVFRRPPRLYFEAVHLPVANLLTECALVVGEPVARGAPAADVARFLRELVALLALGRPFAIPALALCLG